jgi:signal transduction histidine kinase
MRLLPHTLASRTTLVLLAGLLVSNLVGLLIYTQERNLALHNVAGEDIAERIAAVTRTVGGLPEADRAAVACSQSGTGFAAMLTEAPLVRLSDGTKATEQVSGILADLLNSLKPDQLRLASNRTAEETAVLQAFTDTLRRCTTPLAEMRGMGNMPGMVMSMGMVRLMQGWNNTGILRVSLQLEDGDWLNFLTTTPEIRQIWNRRFVLAFLVMSLIVTALSVWAIRRSVAPLDIFARASERLGRDMNAPSLREDGPPEMGRAAKAFNDMQTRLRRLIQDRTQMLAAVSHDLRTPVTRLRLRAEFVEDDEQREKMLADLAQMEAMISATLSFARLDSSDERRKSLDLAGLVQSVVDDAAELGRKVSYEGPDRVSYLGRPMALRRVFDNLLDNAVKYGEEAEISLSTTSETITIAICDKGPGIPPEQVEQVFEPFQRIETSRNRETGGVGLGLAVVRSIIRGHGGEVTLLNRPEGGLCASVTLPLADKD